jgi:hypothetical protein
MTSRDFCFWLQGFLELRGKSEHGLSYEQTVCVERHLAMVFQHEIDPSMGDAKHQATLDNTHAAKPPVGHGGGGPVFRC